MAHDSLAPERNSMAFIRQYLLPFAIVLIFSAALLAVSARIFLPTDLAAPAPVGSMVVPFGFDGLSLEGMDLRGIWAGVGVGV